MLHNFTVRVCDNNSLSIYFKDNIDLRETKYRVGPYKRNSDCCLKPIANRRKTKKAFHNRGFKHNIKK